MKKIVLIFSLLVGFLFTLNAQEIANITIKYNFDVPILLSIDFKPEIWIASGLD